MVNFGCSEQNKTLIQIYKLIRTSFGAKVNLQRK